MKLEIAHIFIYICDFFHFKPLTKHSSTLYYTFIDNCCLFSQLYKHIRKIILTVYPYLTLCCPSCFANCLYSLFNLMRGFMVLFGSFLLPSLTGII